MLQAKLATAEAAKKCEIQQFSSKANLDQKFFSMAFERKPKNSATPQRTVNDNHCKLSRNLGSATSLPNETFFCKKSLQNLGHSLATNKKRSHTPYCMCSSKCVRLWCAPVCANARVWVGKWMGGGCGCCVHNSSDTYKQRLKQILLISEKKRQNNTFNAMSRSGMKHSRCFRCGSEATDATRKPSARKTGR